MVHSMVKNCAGIDVHEAILVVCLMQGELDEEPTTTFREFETLPGSLSDLANWLDEMGCEQVAMESTGIYWKPVWAMLEGHNYNLILANARDIKNKPGRKTDILDAEWIASLLRCGLIDPSFVPKKELRELRNATRLYRKYKQDLVKTKNRMIKLLEESGIKITQQITDIFGATGLKILEKIIKGEEISYTFLLQITTSFGANKLRKKVDEIYRGLQSKISPINLELLQILYETYEQINKTLTKLDNIISDIMNEYSKEEKLLSTIPGISKNSARAIIAKIGTNMSVFPNHKHISSWAGICPGNHESAGKKKKAKTTKRGSKALKATLCESAWSCIKRKDCIFSKLYGIYSKRMGKQKALIAVANKILQVCYIILRDHVVYKEVEIAQEKKMEERKIKKMISLLEKSGYEINIKTHQTNVNI